MFQIKKFKNIFLIYLLFLYFAAVYYLFLKHTGGSDSTISEWLVNYYGGFTRRGLSGHIFAQISILFDLPIRFVIFIFQSFFYLIFLILIYFFFKKIKNNFLLSLCLFCPLLLTYHVAELEILTRKEVLIFINFLVFLLLSLNTNLTKYTNIYLFISIPILLLIWEPIIFFLPFYIFILINSINYKNYKSLIFNIFSIFSSSLIVIYFLLINQYGIKNETLMCLNLKELFDERCYMSLAYLDTSIKENFDSLFRDIKIQHIFRYSLVYLIGFFPLIYLSRNLKKKINFKIEILNNISIFYYIIICSIFVPILYAMGLDWGRWVNIHYFFIFCSVYFLIKKGNYTLNNHSSEKFKKILYIKNKVILVSLFIIFCFGWNPKTLFKGDIASMPGYRVPYNLIKSINNNF